MADKEPKLETKSKQMINQTMNDPIKYLITGAAIALVCGTAGTIGGAWIMKDASGPRLQVRSQGPTINGQPSPITIQPANLNNPTVFNGQRLQQNPTITIPPRPGGPSVAHPPSGNPTMSYNQFQKLNELPDVKAARDAFMEAQKKYSETMKKAAESSQSTVASVSKITPVTLQAPPPPGSGPAATAPKVSPITIQIPPAGSTNGVGKTGM